MRQTEGREAGEAEEEEDDVEAPWIENANGNGIKRLRMCIC